MRIAFLDALARAITNLNKPVVSSFDIFLEAFKIDENNGYQDLILYHQNNVFGKEKTSSLIRDLMQKNIIYKDPDFSRHYYRVSKLNDVTAEEVCCLVDPFCYISHLSAMKKYDLTDRIPAINILSTPDKSSWKKMKDEFEKSAFLNQRNNIEYMPLRKSIFPEIVRGMKVQRLETKYFTKPINIKNSYARMSEIGATFVDMLEKPNLCGGMSHILEIWKSHSKIYIDEIVQAVDNNPKKIIKVRAGYILDEMIGCKNERVYKWVENVQRGSSQVLNPDAPFAATFSEKWMLSINV